MAVSGSKFCIENIWVWCKQDRTLFVGGGQWGFQWRWSDPYSPFPSQTELRASQPSSVIQQADPSNPFHSTTVSSSTTASSPTFASVGTPAQTPSQTHTPSRHVTPATTPAPRPTPAPTPPVAAATLAPAQLQALRPQSLFISVQAPAHRHAQSDPLAY